MTQAEYVDSLIKRRRRSWTILLLIFVASALFIFVSLLEVKSSLFFPIPQAASRYLLYTAFTKFSVDEVTSILQAESRSMVLLTYLLVLYWGYHISALLVMLVFPIAVALRFRRAQTYQVTLLQVHNLIRAITRHEERSRSFSKLGIRAALFFADLYTPISPLRSRWFKRPQYQWFMTTNITRDERAIISTLRRFEHSMETFLSNNRDLTPFLKPLLSLSDFLWSVAAASDIKRKASTSRPEVSPEQQKQYLVNFARTARPLVIEANRIEKLKQPISWLQSFFHRVFHSRTVRVLIAISLGSALVMALGVILFKIDLSQAFLTWFTVTFGSFTISVGISAVSFVTHKHEPDHDDGAGA